MDRLANKFDMVSFLSQLPLLSSSPISPEADKVPCCASIGYVSSSNACRVQALVCLSLFCTGILWGGGWRKVGHFLDRGSLCGSHWSPVGVSRGSVLLCLGCLAVQVVRVGWWSWYGGDTVETPEGGKQTRKVTRQFVNSPRVQWCRSSLGLFFPLLGKNKKEGEIVMAGNGGGNDTQTYPCRLLGCLGAPWAAQGLEGGRGQCHAPLDL